jgi:hypothetical protein
MNFLNVYEIIKSSNHQIIKSSNHQIIKSSNHQIIKSSNHQIIKSSNHQIIKSSNHQIIKSSNHQIIKSSNQIKYSIVIVHVKLAFLFRVVIWAVGATTQIFFLQKAVAHQTTSFCKIRKIEILKKKLRNIFLRY